MELRPSQPSESRALIELAEGTGAPVYMGDPPLHYRGRMPVYDYLKDQEIAAGYAFLAAYPPQTK